MKKPFTTIAMIFAFIGLYAMAKTVPGNPFAFFSNTSYLVSTVVVLFCTLIVIIGSHFENQEI